MTALLGHGRDDTRYALVKALLPLAVLLALAVAALEVVKALRLRRTHLRRRSHGNRNGRHRLRVGERLKAGRRLQSRRRRRHGRKRFRLVTRRHADHRLLRWRWSVKFESGTRKLPFSNSNFRRQLRLDALRSLLRDLQMLLELGLLLGEELRVEFGGLRHLLLTLCRDGCRVRPLQGLTQLPGLVAVDVADRT